MAVKGSTFAQSALRAYRRRPGPDTRRAVIEAHLPLVDRVARRRAAAGEPREDVVQAGRVGLIKAVDRYDPAHGDLEPFAVAFIDGEIRHHLRDGTAAVRAPRPVRDLGIRARRTEAELAARTGHEPTATEVARELRRSPEAVGEALAALAAVVPLTGIDPAAPADDRDAHLALGRALATLPERDRRIVELRFLEDRSQVDIAHELGLSTASVSRLLRAALETLRRALEPEATVVTTDGAAYAAPEMAQRAVARQDSEAARSGRLLVRMPQTLHEELAEAAEREGVSLNAFVTSALASAVHWRDGEHDDAAPAQHAEPPRSSRWAAYATVANVVVVALAAAVAIVLLASAL